MSLSSTEQLGKYIGGVMREQDNIDKNIAPEDAEFVNTIKNEEQLPLTGKASGYKLIYDEYAFVLDHSVQGELDSGVYQIDTGYRDSSSIYFPLSIPVQWDKGYRERVFEVVI